MYLLVQNAGSWQGAPAHGPSLGTHADPSVLLFEVQNHRVTCRGCKLCSRRSTAFWWRHGAAQDFTVTLGPDSKQLAQQSGRFRRSQQPTYLMNAVSGPARRRAAKNEHAGAQSSAAACKAGASRIVDRAKASGDAAATQKHTKLPRQPEHCDVVLSPAVSGPAVTSDHYPDWQLFWPAPGRRTPLAKMSSGT